MKCSYDEKDYGEDYEKDYEKDLETIEDSENTFPCDRCHKTFKMYYGSEQGDGCSTSRYYNPKTNRIYFSCGFGSIYDYVTFQQIDEDMNYRNICDNCILLLIREHKIRLADPGLGEPTMTYICEHCLKLYPDGYERIVVQAFPKPDNLMTETMMTSKFLAGCVDSDIYSETEEYRFTRMIKDASGKSIDREVTSLHPKKGVFPKCIENIPPSEYILICIPCSSIIKSHHSESHPSPP